MEPIATKNTGRNARSRLRVIGLALTFVAASMFLASCGDELSEGNGGGQDSTAQQAAGGGGAAGETTMGETAMGGGTTMGETTMGGTTMGGTTGGTTMGGTTMGGATGGTTAAGPAITDIQGILDEQNPESLVGRQVRLTDVPVQAVVGDASFLVGPSGDRSVLTAIQGEVLNTQPETAAQVSPAERVTLEGQIEQVDSVPQLRQDLGLGGLGADILREQGLYISATQVQSQ